VLLGLQGASASGPGLGLILLMPRPSPPGRGLAPIQFAPSVAGALLPTLLGLQLASPAPASAPLRSGLIFGPELGVGVRPPL